MLFRKYCLTVLWLLLLPVMNITATDRVAFDIEQKIRDDFLSDGNEYTIIIPQQITAPLDGYDLLMIEPQRGAEPLGNFAVKIIFYLNGKIVKQVSTSIRINQYQDVLIANQKIKRKEFVSEEMFQLARREISKLKDKPLTSLEGLEDYCAARLILRNAVLTKKMLKKIDLIERGDLVTIEYVKNNIVITATGEARQSGGRGKKIKVKNVNSNRTIIAEVYDEQTVRVFK